MIAAPEPSCCAGSDVFWNLVFPAPVARTRYVRAMEILPGNKRVVHHANVLLDRRLAGSDGHSRSRFPGMTSRSRPTSSSPTATSCSGSQARRRWLNRRDWPLAAGTATDLIVNLPSPQESGTDSAVDRAVLHRHAPARTPMLLQLEHDGALDISPGDAAFEVTDSLELPVDVQVLGVYRTRTIWARR
jgi:hypothetical protein